MIVVARLDKSCRIGKQSYFLCQWFGKKIKTKKAVKTFKNKKT